MHTPWEVFIFVVKYSQHGCCINGAKVLRSEISFIGYYSKIENAEPEDCANFAQGKLNNRSRVQLMYREYVNGESMTDPILSSSLVVGSFQYILLSRLSLS